jgi:hypothetical protein
MPRKEKRDRSTLKMKLTLTGPEYDMLSIQIARLAKVMREGAKKPNDHMRPEYTTAMSAERKVPTLEDKSPPDAQITVLVNRRELRKFEELMESSIEKLNNSVLPAYEVRISKSDKERADFYRDYVNELTKLRDGIWKPILKKVQDLL